MADTHFDVDVKSDELSDKDGSIDKTLDEVFDRLSSDEPPEAETGSEKPSRVRGPDGKFVKTDAPQEAAAKPGPEVQGKPVKPVKPEEPEEPEHWSAVPKASDKGRDDRINAFRRSLRADVRDEFDKLSDSLKDDLLRRNDDFHKGLGQSKEEAEIGKALKAVTAPYQATLQAMQIDMPTAVQRLLAADHALRYSQPGDKVRLGLELAAQYNIPPVEFIRAIAEATGTDLSKLADRPRQTESVQFDPTILQPHLAPVVQQVQAANQELMALKQQLARQQQAEAEAFFNSFASERTPDGKLKHEFIDDVRDEVIDRVATGKSASFEEAYEHAVWARPDTRAALLKRQQEEERARASKAAAEARKAQGVALKTQGTQATPSAPKGKLFEDLGDLYDKISGVA